MNNQGDVENKGINGKAIGSLIIGIISILGFILIEGDSILSIAGLLLGIIGIREIKKFKQNGRSLALTGVIFNCFGILVLIL